jgi:hypothetical protein
MAVGDAMSSTCSRPNVMSANDSFGGGGSGGRVVVVVVDEVDEVDDVEDVDVEVDAVEVVARSPAVLVGTAVVGPAPSPATTPAGSVSADVGAAGVDRATVLTGASVVGNVPAVRSAG